jgi:hypothetical protein
MVWSAPPTWNESFPARDIAFAHEAARYIASKTRGSATNDELNAVVLSWGREVGKPLHNSPKTKSESRCEISSKLAEARHLQ